MKHYFLFQFRLIVSDCLEFYIKKDLEESSGGSVGKSAVID